MPASPLLKKLKSLPYSYENLLKSDLEVALEEHLRANEASLKKDPILEPFYRRIAASPIKRENTGTVTSGEEYKKPRVRRQTKAREEIEQP